MNNALFPVKPQITKLETNYCMWQHWSNYGHDRQNHQSEKARKPTSKSDYDRNIKNSKLLTVTFIQFVRRQSSSPWISPKGVPYEVFQKRDFPPKIVNLFDKIVQNTKGSLLDVFRTKRQKALITLMQKQETSTNTASKFFWIPIPRVHTFGSINTKKFLR